MPGTAWPAAHGVRPRPRRTGPTGQPHERTAAQLHQELADTAAILFRAGLLTEFGGNLSARLPGGATALITPSRLPKGRLRAADILEIDLQGLPVRRSGESVGAGDARAAGESGASGLRPSVEARAHALIYRARPDVNAIVHGHPPCATEVAASELPAGFLFPERAGGRGWSVPRLPPMAPGSAELAEALTRALAASDAALLAGHGVFVVGALLDDAVRRGLDLEGACREALAARGPVAHPLEPGGQA